VWSCFIEVIGLTSGLAEFIAGKTDESRMKALWWKKLDCFAKLSSWRRPHDRFDLTSVCSPDQV
jgi:hypothetical protein